LPLVCFSLDLFGLTQHLFRWFVQPGGVQILGCGAEVIETPFEVAVGAPLGFAQFAEHLFLHFTALPFQPFRLVHPAFTAELGNLLTQLCEVPLRLDTLQVSSQLFGLAF
jgi:hypothetical protein